MRALAVWKPINVMDKNLENMKKWRMKTFLSILWVKSSIQHPLCLFRRWDEASSKKIQRYGFADY